jgi:tetrapyrrole methylase family protein/MazG family protein
VITIVGLGVKTVDQVTRETERAIRGCNEVLFVDTGVATREFLESLCPRVTPLFGESYVEQDRRFDAYHHMAARVVEAALDHGPVVFAMHGHPLVGAYAPFVIRDLADAMGIPVRVLPGVCSMDALFTALMLDPVATGLQTYECTDLLLRRRPLQPDVPAILWGIGTVETRLHSTRHSRPERFHRLVRHLVQFYPADHAVAAMYVSPHPFLPDERHVFPLGAMPDHAGHLHHGTSLYLPPVELRAVQDPELAYLVDDPAHLAGITR